MWKMNSLVTREAQQIKLKHQCWAIINSVILKASAFIIYSNFIKFLLAKAIFCQFLYLIPPEIVGSFLQTASAY